jgi:hypothetical protein
MSNDFWFKFNFKDWANDVKPLSLSARGLLIELIIYMRRPENSGEMPNDPILISRLTGELTETVIRNLSEIEKFAILSFEKNAAGESVIISRKIVKEFSISLKNRENAKKGGNPLLKKNENRLSDSDNRTDNRVSYSYSNSNSNSLKEKKGVEWEKKEKAKKPKKSDLILDHCPDHLRKGLELWLPYKAEKGQRYTQRGLETAFSLWAKDYPTEEKFVAAVRFSMSQNWSGIFPQKIQTNQTTNSNGQIPRDQRDDALANWSL